MSLSSQDITNYRVGHFRLSIVSHDQDNLVHKLLMSVASYCDTENLSVTVVRNTKNANESLNKIYPFPVTIIQNERPRGFGANHNQAFTTCREEFFCVLNPDILIYSNIFIDLQRHLSEKSIGVVSPVLCDTTGLIQDNARTFPTPGRIFQKAITGKKHTYNTVVTRQFYYPDWVAGMFMVFPSPVYKLIGGFDERYFMYYEDVDICARLKRAGYRAKIVGQVRAIHDAQRASHRSLRHLIWHLSSMVKFFRRYPDIDRPS